MTDTPLDLSPLVDSTPGLTPEARERLAARLQTLIESEQVGHVESRRTWQPASWTHRAVVVAVAAAIVVVFFVPLPHVSLFHSLVAPAKTTPASTSTVTSAKVTPTAVTGADGDLWLLGTYPCATGTCPVLLRSSDGGEAFVRVGTPPPSADTLAFANREDGYAYFEGATTVKSVLYWTGDGGRSWRLEPAAFQESQSLSIVTTEGRAYVLADEGCVENGGCKTLDLGSSTVTSDRWTIRRVPIDAAEYSVGLAAFGAKVWLIVVSDGGSSAKVLVSDDGGATFTNLPSTGMGGLACRARATSATTLWGFCATGNVGGVVRSTDGGRNFSTVSGWMRGHRPAANGGLILPLSNTEAVFQPGVAGMWLTRDGGAHFSAVRFSSLWLSDSYGFDITFASTTAWLVLGVDEGPGGSNLMWRTSNGGRTWQSVRPPTVPTPLPAVDLSATPNGWVPVVDRDAQISVPATSWVFYPRGDWCRDATTFGSVYLGNEEPPACAQTVTNTLIVRPIVHADLALETPPAHYVNGLLVWDLVGHPTATSGTYMVPELGVVVSASGPLTSRLLATVAYSPRTTVLASGPVPVVPSSWRSVSFAGLRFSTPRSWPVYHTRVTPGLGNVCQNPGVALVGITSVLLSNDAWHWLLPPCGYRKPVYQVPESGVQVDSGLRTEPQLALSFPKHCLDLHGLTACPATSPAYSILVLKVTVPGRSKPVYVSIGLAGNGMVARTIMYSLRAA